MPADGPPIARTRRRLLAAASGLSVGVAGCLGTLGSGEDSGATGPAGNGTAGPESSGEATAENRSASQTSGSQEPASAESLAATDAAAVDDWTSDVALPSARVDASTLDAAVRRGRLAFALDLHRARVDASDARSVTSSPFSLASVLSMVAGGARGATRTEIESALGVEGERLHEIAAATVRDLARHEPDAGPPIGDVLGIANAVWHDPDAQLRQAFVDLLRQYYGAARSQIAFSDSPADARSTINDWVAARTADRIPELLPEGSIDHLTKVVLVNALRFDGRWAKPFDPEETSTEEFVGVDGATGEVAVMNKRVELPHYENGQLQLLELPYEDGRLAMDVVLPVDRSLPSLVSTLTADGLQRAIGNASERTVYVSLPRFTARSGGGLNRPLEALGIETLFDPEGVDLGAMSPVLADPRLEVKVVQKCVVDVGERGTAAAAATAAAVGILSGPPSFDATSPFLYLIRDRPTGAVLFSGRIADPDAAADDGE